MGAEGIGVQPYQGLSFEPEKIIANHVSANIQLKSELRPPEAKLPGEAAHGT